MTTRALYLGGLDPMNRNTNDRGITMHGTNHPEALGTPVSGGCVSLDAADSIRFSDVLAVGDRGYILGDE